MILAETGSAAVADPLGGSWLVERLTDELCEEAAERIAAIDARGGMVAAVEAGLPQAEIADAAYRFQRAVEAGARTIVGVNDFRDDGEEPPPLHRPDPGAELVQAEAVGAWRGGRDGPRVAAALEGVRRACEGADNVMPPLIEAARAGATIGEMCDAFRAVWGPYRDPGTW
jgi:methylmalonyl-CoA mutase N-terminal domain/subunit